MQYRAKSVFSDWLKVKPAAWFHVPSILHSITRINRWHLFL